ncbi:GNAT family N-acetyltransferase [Shewanella oneidensis MR-1]|uniref:Acteyltransferase GNAT family n=1 Tax=Shewanella oneidensis (strain ATCC 700550 / JCM 31522 / CIP 106686 / LMG 19005 / NCIMB 14063 / MR-1) TaxID=211586 RepID=Q8EFT3_SHEON|nr:GNAT family N-acetyltransferase [Shewanella oneidensis]AAN54935.1 acteyltransferase GNAT family [Shewanella oneidensis MR-1]MDX5996348.1 GNAT family N-acetyltransferase [Shewanella oneidensis]MEE2028953.1 Aminoalkylphosphonate N-acetyltransferase [Shewanella oneidensis]QKG96539.1 GNAT family N-acetyltransferase [Shewanella oneidensis MR-1]
MGAISIRQAQIADLNPIATLLLQLGYLATEAQLQQYLDDPKRSDEIYLAESEGVVVGLISLIFFDYFPSQQQICRITALVVTEASRGLGVGTQLIDFAKDRASERDCRQLEVTTSMHREKTQAYYESIGFEKSSFRYIQAIEDK